MEINEIKTFDFGPSKVFVSLKVFDLIGKEVTTNGMKSICQPEFISIACKQVSLLTKKAYFVARE